VLNENDIVEEGLARTALTEFLHRGFHAPTFSVFHEKDPIRIAYVGTSTSNLAYLVGQESPYHGDASLHFSFPSIRPALPWKPSNDLPLVKWYSNMAHDVSLLPEKEVCDQLVQDFFTKIHPGFPVVDEAEFRSQYGNDKTPVPLLLLQSVLLAGAHVCQHPKVAKSRSLVKVALFRRAKALFDLHYENNREHLIQAALLFTWHFEGADDIAANAYYWIGVACRLAFGLGWHRNLSSSARSVIPIQDRRIQRRLFWVLFQYDVLASLHHGRPLMINEDDCDQPPLVLEDFIEIDGQLNKNVHFDYCDQSIKLCYIIISVLKLFSPGSLRRHRLGQQTIESSRSTLDSQLEGWFLRLPQSLINPSRNTEDFWCTQLHMHYNLALLQLYRTSYLPTYPGGPDLSLAPSLKTMEICHNAASSMSRLFNSLLISSKIDRCCFTALTMLLAAAIQMSLEARSAGSSGSSILGLQAQCRLEDLFAVMNEVAKYWPSAEAIYRLFQDVLNTMKAEMERSLAASDLLTMRERGTLASQPNGSVTSNTQGRFLDNQIGLSDQDWNGLLGTWDPSAFFDGDLNGMNI
jgi:transcriptional regulatory protein AMDR